MIPSRMMHYVYDNNLNKITLLSLLLIIFCNVNHAGGGVVNISLQDKLVRRKFVLYKV